VYLPDDWEQNKKQKSMQIPDVVFSEKQIDASEHGKRFLVAHSSLEVSGRP